MIISYFVSNHKAFYTDPTPLGLWEKSYVAGKTYYFSYLPRTEDWTNCIGLVNKIDYFEDNYTILEAETREEAIEEFKKFLLVEKLRR